MDKKEFIEKWKWQKTTGGGSASFDFGNVLEKDLNELLKANRFDALVREKIAEKVHESWSIWMKYLFSQCDNAPSEFEEGTQLLPAWAFDRWQRQMNTKYEDLTENEKKSDREHADKIVGIIRNFTA